MNKLRLLPVLLLVVPSPASPGAICSGGRCGSSAIEVATIRAPAGAIAYVPVYLRDAPDTPLGPERGGAAQIDGVAFRIRFSPVADIVAARLVPTTDKRGPAPRLETAPRTADGISYLLARTPTTPGMPRPKLQELGVLELTLAPRLASGSRVELRLDPAVSVLSNAAGTVSESVANGYLTLRNGAIEVE